jgi:hypothetical protein
MARRATAEVIASGSTLEIIRNKTMRYTEISPIRPITLPGIPGPSMIEADALALAERKRRQEELLDAALLETFPASDPVSVMCIM